MEGEDGPDYRLGCPCVVPCLLRLFISIPNGECGYLKIFSSRFLWSTDSLALLGERSGLFQVKAAANTKDMSGLYGIAAARA